MFACFLECQLIFYFVSFLPIVLCPWQAGKLLVDHFDPFELCWGRSRVAFTSKTVEPYHWSGGLWNLPWMTQWSTNTSLAGWSSDVFPFCVSSGNCSARRSQVIFYLAWCSFTLCTYSLVLSKETRAFLCRFMKQFNCIDPSFPELCPEFPTASASPSFKLYILC